MTWGSAFGEFILFVVYIICYPLVDCLIAPATCGAIADCLCNLVALSLSCSRLAIASPSSRRRLAVTLPPPFARHCHHHVRRHCPTRTAMVTAITIGIVGRYPYWCCCHHQRRSFRRRLPDAPAAPPLPLSFVTEPTAVRLRLATVPRQRRRMQRRRRSATDAMALTPDATWMNPSSAWRMGSSSTQSSQRRHRGAAAAESSDHDNVDACDQHRRIVHWAGGKATMAAASRRRMTTTPTWKQGGSRAISWRSSSADFGKGVSGGGG